MLGRAGVLARAGFGRGSGAGSRDQPVKLQVDSTGLGSEFGIALRRTLGSLLVAVAGDMPPAIVVVVVQGQQVFHAEVPRVNAMRGTKMSLNFCEAGCPVAVHVPPRAGDP